MIFRQRHQENTIYRKMLALSAGVSFFSKNVVRDFSIMLSALNGHSDGRSAPMTDTQMQIVEFREKSQEALRKIEDASKELERIDKKGNAKDEKQAR